MCRQRYARPKRHPLSFLVLASCSTSRSTSGSVMGPSAHREHATLCRQSSGALHRCLTIAALAVMVASHQSISGRRDRSCGLQVGGLLSWKGTVTRTTEVRPELYMATFRCKDCGERVRNVEQQFVLTYPMMCTGVACGNKRNWILVKEESKFVDWQRAKVQENSDEVRTSTQTVALRCDPAAVIPVPLVGSHTL
jgi:hypothetical protein